MELVSGLQSTFDFLDSHCAYFTYAENYGGADCGPPFSDRYDFHTTRQPVLTDLWQTSAPPGRSSPPAGFPRAMSLTPVSRRPTQLADETAQAVLVSPIPGAQRPSESRNPEASIVVVSYDSLLFTRLCLESVLAHTMPPEFELIVVDNGSSDGSREYLLELADRSPRVRLIANGRNIGFPAACNQGLAIARGEILTLLNSDTMVAPGWLARLAAHLEDDSVGLVGPLTNRIGNEAEVATDYETWGGFLDEAARRAAAEPGRGFEIPTVTMFCLAMRRSAWERLGPLDTDFGVGTLEDDDYSLRARKAGYRLLCAEDVLVHHFGEGSFGKLFSDGEYSRVIDRNRQRFELKWGTPWEPYERRQPAEYEPLVEHVREILSASLPAGSTVLVVSKGDERLVELDGLRGWHFPRTPDGIWAGRHPADSAEAIAQLEELQEAGASYIAIPRTAFWWLDFYEDFARHLGRRRGPSVEEDDCLVFALDPGEGPALAGQAGDAGE